MILDNKAAARIAVRIPSWVGLRELWADISGDSAAVSVLGLAASVEIFNGEAAFDRPTIEALSPNT